MNKYIDQMRTQKLNTVKRTRRGLPVKKCLDILTFDIEVTSAWMDPKKGLIPYTKGKPAEYWNSMEKYALPYIWQFSFNEDVYYGRNIYSFKNVLEDLPGDVEYICWIHNLAYEFMFLINFLTVKKVFARAPHKPMYVIFEEFPNITFKCSYILTNLSLEKWGKQLGFEKLKTLDYNAKLRTPYTELDELELAYCSRDCEIVYRGILDHLKHYKDVWDIPNTSTGKIRRVIKKKVVYDYEYMKDMKKLIPKDPEEVTRLQTLFQGGFTHANRKYMGQIVGPGEHGDFSSSYPYEIICELYPYNRWCYFGRQLPDPKTFGYRAYIMELKFTGLQCITWTTYISGAKSRGKGIIQDNGRVLKADELYTGPITEQDYITICNHYKWEKVECLSTWVAHKRYLPTAIVDYVLSLYEDKTKLKGVEEEKTRYDISKTYVNGVFG